MKKKVKLCRFVLVEHWSENKKFDSLVKWCITNNSEPRKSSQSVTMQALKHQRTALCLSFNSQRIYIYLFPMSRLPDLYQVPVSWLIVSLNVPDGKTSVVSDLMTKIIHCIQLIFLCQQIKRTVKTFKTSRPKNIAVINSY